MIHHVSRDTYKTRSINFILKYRNYFFVCQWFGFTEYTNPIPKVVGYPIEAWAKK